VRKKRGTIIIFIIVLLFVVAVVTKPSDKQIKKKAIKSIWGNLVPDENKYPGYYNQFMDYTTTSVYIDDWLVIKRIRFKSGKEIKPVGFAALGETFIRN
jgi:hypothetical protein